MRLLFAKVGDCYCHSCGHPIKPQTVEQIMEEIQREYGGEKVYLLKETASLKNTDELQKFVKNNKTKVEKGEGFTRYLLVREPKEEVSDVDLLLNAKKKKRTFNGKALLQPIEYFYLEDPSVPQDYFPLKVYGIFDRVTVDETKIPRLKEDIIKILGSQKKFGIFRAESAKKSESETPKVERGGKSNISLEGLENLTEKEEEKKEKKSDSLQRFTDKMFCPNCNIVYPEFTTKHFSPNRQEGACEHCNGIGEILQVDYNKIIDPNSAFKNAILPWRDSNLGQEVLRKLAEKYSMDLEKPRKDQPERFLHTVVYGDNENMRVMIA